jgi:hypothetical protein
MSEHVFDWPDPSGLLIVFQIKFDGDTYPGLH